MSTFASSIRNSSDQDGSGIPDTSLYLILDYETRSECELKTAGAYKYARDVTTKILCVAWRFGTKVELKNQKTKVWSPYFLGAYGEFKRALFDPNVILCASNAMFEQMITRYVLLKYIRDERLKTIPHSRWRCIAAQARAHALPGKLELCCEALKLGIAKDMEGHRLMLKMSKPRKPTKNNPAKWHNRVKDLKRLTEYCQRDVDAETAIFLTVPPLSAYEQKVWELDQVINLRGFAVDLELVDKALELIPEEVENLKAETRILTGDLVQSPTQVAEMLSYLSAYCAVNLPDLRAQTVIDALADPTLNPLARRLLELRQGVARTSTAKYVRFRARTDTDGRARDTQVYHAASTGRQAGSGINPLNLPRKTPDDPEFAATAVKTHGLEFLRAVFGNPLELLASLLKGCIVAAPGNELFSGDKAAIEVRVLFWLAGHEAGLKAYREGRDLYREIAVHIYRVSLIDVADDQRQIGKRAILGAGFQMGPDRFVTMCAEFGTETTLEVATRAIDAYRELHAPVKKLWYDVQTAAISAVQEPGRVFRAGRCKWFKQGRYLYAELPSGRRIAYVDPEVRWVRSKIRVRLDDGSIKTKTIVSLKLFYWGVDPRTKKWKREITFGGKLVENIVQATARDLLVADTFRTEAVGYKTVLTVYDSNTAERPKSDRKAEDFGRLMNQLPPWAEGIPMKVDTWKSERNLK